MYIMKTSKEFAALHLTANEVITGLNKYFDGFLLDNVCFYSAEMDYTYCYSPKCCLAAAILWLHEQGVNYFCGMPLSCGEEKQEDSLCELAEKYNTLRTGLINALGAEPYMTGYQLICKVSSLYYFRREVQRKLGCLGQSDADTMPVLLKTIDKAKCFEDMDKQYMETTKSLCEIAEIIERLQSTDEKKDS